MHLIMSLFKSVIFGSVKEGKNLNFTMTNVIIFGSAKAVKQNIFF